MYKFIENRRTISIIYNVNINHIILICDMWHMRWYNYTIMDVITIYILWYIPTILIHLFLVILEFLIHVIISSNLYIIHMCSSLKEIYNISPFIVYPLFQVIRLGNLTPIEHLTSYTVHSRLKRYIPLSCKYLWYHRVGTLSWLLTYKYKGI
jgi:hypothetical protein